MSGLNQVSGLLSQLAKQTGDANLKILANKAKDKVDQMINKGGGKGTGTSDQKSNSDRLDSLAVAKKEAEDMGLNAEETAQWIKDSQKKYNLTGSDAIASTDDTSIPSPTIVDYNNGGSGPFEGATSNNTQTWITGIDVSVHQGNIDWKMVKNSGKVGFAFIRSSIGMQIDRNFVFNWHDSLEAEVIRGAYHYYSNKISPEDQADFFIQTIKEQGGIKNGDLPAVIDIEVDPKQYNYGINSKDLKDKLPLFIENLKKFLLIVETELSRTPIIYSGYNTWHDLLKNPTDFSKYPLWVPAYINKSCPTKFGGWEYWTFWQYSDQGIIPGIKENKVDLNVFSDSLDRLYELTNLI